MRRLSFILVLLVLCASMYAQPVQVSPAHTVTTYVPTLRPTFVWNAVANATSYELYFTSTLTDTSTNKATVPSAASLNKSKRYISLTDTTYAVADTLLLKNTVYFWKVRAKVNDTLRTWSTTYFKFRVSAPQAFIANANAWIKFNHDTLGAITSVKYLGGSRLQILDTVYNTAKFLGIGGNGPVAQRDTIISWSAVADNPSIFTYKNAVKYGATGSKVLTVTHGASGVTADVALVLERTKTVTMAAAWRPGNDVLSGNDRVLFVKSAAETTHLVYPATKASIGPDSMRFSAMYDRRYNEYFGFKSDSLIAVEDSQQLGSATAYGLLNKLKFSNATESNKTFSFSFAVRKSRADYFDTWADKRYIFVSKPVAGDSLVSHDKMVYWESFGATPASIAFSSDGGSTFNNPTTLAGTDTSALDSAQYYIPGGPYRSNCVLKVTSTDGDVGLSSVFKIIKGYAAITTPRVFGAPSSDVAVPISIRNYVAGDSVHAFDIKLTFDSSFVKFDSVVYNSSLDNWIKGMVYSNTQADSGNYVRVSAFRNATGLGVKDAELFRLYFSADTDQANIGLSSNLKIKNATLSAAGNGAYSINVADSSTDGVFKVYSSIAGKVRYLHAKTTTTNYLISGDSLITYTDATNPINNSVWPIVAGAFNMTSREPNDVVTFYPSASKYMSYWDDITVADAQLAFMNDTMHVRARIAADVNEDSLVNTTDAMAIMEISVDSTYLAGIGKSVWIFVDSTSLVGFESRADSLTAWFTQHQHSLSYTLVAQRTNQNFFGVLRGDVNFSGGAASLNVMKRLDVTNASPVLFSTDANLSVRPGDSVWIPLNIYPAENSIGGFNARLQVDPSIFTYAGQFKMGQSIPQDKNWYITAKGGADGLLRVAATDFSSDISPITQDGPALMFKYIVNGSVKLGTSSLIDVQAQSVVDKNMQSMASTVQSGQVEVSRMGSAIATSYGLEQNYPNPFNPTTTIEFALPMDSKVDIKIFNMLGQQVANLFSGLQTAGYHQVVWNASNCGSGVYFYVMSATSGSGGESFRSVRKLILMK